MATAQNVIGIYVFEYAKTSAWVLLIDKNLQRYQHWMVLHKNCHRECQSAKVVDTAIGWIFNEADSLR